MKSPTHAPTLFDINSQFEYPYIVGSDELQAQMRLVQRFSVLWKSNSEKFVQKRVKSSDGESKVHWTLGGERNWVILKNLSKAIDYWCRKQRKQIHRE